MQCQLRLSIALARTRLPGTCSMERESKIHIPIFAGLAVALRRTGGVLVDGQEQMHARTGDGRAGKEGIGSLSALY